MISKTMRSMLDVFLGNVFLGSSMTSSPFRAPRSILRLETLEERLCPANVTWTGAGKTDLWSNGQNWNTGTAPTVNDTIIFDQTTGPKANSPSNMNISFAGTIPELDLQDYTGNLTFAESISIAVFDFGGATLGGSSTVTVTKSFVWKGDGTIGDGNSGKLILEGGGRMSGSNAGFIGNIDGWSVENYGILTWNAAAGALGCNRRSGAYCGGLEKLG